MAKAKEKVVKLKEEDNMIYFKAIRPLTDEEHIQLSEKLRYEAQQSGKNIILVPLSAALSNAKGE